MEVVDFTLSDNINKDSVDSASETKQIFKKQLGRKEGPRLYFTKGTKGRGGQGLGKFHEIIGLSLDNNGRLFAEYVVDKAGHFYQYQLIQTEGGV
jgi:hypothetical protein